MTINRRDFVLAAAGALGGLASWARNPHAELLRLGLVATEADAPSTLGARLGAEEAARAATLFGTAVEMSTAADAQALLDAHAQVLIGGADDDACERLSVAAERAGVLFLNVGATSDALRAERCRAHTFHVTASARMRRDAAAAPDAAQGEVRLWHDSLTQFGAAQLNDRFRVHFGTPMTDDAWAAWMAMKIASEAALRTRSATPASLMAYLTRPGVRFDGHKGRPLSFGAADHQLRQPLYRVQSTPDGETAAEIRLGASAPESGGTCGSAPR